MDLVDEEDVTRLEVCENGRKVTLALDGGTRGGMELGSHLVCHDARERGLAQARRTREDDVVKRLVTVFCSLNENTEVLAYAHLTEIFVERLRTKVAILLEVLGRESARDRTRVLSLGPDGTVYASRKEVALARLPHQLPLPKRLSA